MTITLRPEQEAWLRNRVANGEFVSVEEAARRLLDERIAELENGEDENTHDLTWAKSYVDAGVAALDRGDVVSLEDYKAGVAALLGSIKG
jgi:antitoxin ParD1/3/4